MIDLLGLDFPALCELVNGLGGGPKMAAQLMRSLYREQPETVRAVSGVNRAFLDRLAGCARPGWLEVRRTFRDATDGACKLILAGPDGAEFETVVLPDRDRLTVCLSSQLGCRMGCVFCRTGRMGLVRNLTAAEIVGQAVAARASLPPGRCLTNVVYMGMGEPLDNLDAVWRSYGILQDPRGLAVPRNRITVSTAGHLPGLERLAASGVPVNLAVSLNASTDAVRSELMPVNRAWPMASLFESLDRFPRRRTRQICLGYVLLEGVNDGEDDVERLARQLAGRPFKVNVIAYNSIPGLPYRSPPAERVEAFASALAHRGIWTMIRDSRGREVMGACGQLGGGLEARGERRRIMGRRHHQDPRTRRTARR